MYITGSTKHESPQGPIYILHGRYRIHLELVLSVRYQLHGIESTLVAGNKYLARELCGGKYWRLLDWDERRRVGSVISHLVHTGGLGLVKLNASGTWPNRYALPGVLASTTSGQERLGATGQ